MKLKLDKVLENLDGVKVADGNRCVQGSPPVFLTYRTVLVDCILLPDQAAQGSEKLERHFLATRIHKAKKEVDLKKKEIELIKELVQKHPSPLVVGQITESLEKK